MNNLALVDKIPSHMARWGTGRLPASEHSSATRQGDGLEVLDLGNCSLPFSAVQDAFMSKTWSHLRSLSLHSNPLAISHPDYAVLLQESDTLPKLQIIDSKRIVQRKRKGEVQESKIERRRREKKEKKRMTGANARETTGPVRVWGESGPLSVSSTTVAESSVSKDSSTVDNAAEGDASPKADKKRKRKPNTIVPISAMSDARKPTSPPAPETAQPAEKKRKRVKPIRKVEPEAITAANAVLTESAVGQHTAGTSSSAGGGVDGKSQRPKRKADDGKVELVAKSAGGVDLTQVFGKPPLRDDIGGLGVGGW
jgi:hypothetical protein